MFKILIYASLYSYWFIFTLWQPPDKWDIHNTLILTWTIMLVHLTSGPICWELPLWWGLTKLLQLLKLQIRCTRCFMNQAQHISINTSNKTYVHKINKNWSIRVSAYTCMNKTEERRVGQLGGLYMWLCKQSERCLHIMYR